VRSIKNHPLIGVGTGGQQKAFAAIYDRRGTVLEEEWQWMHSHNQLLSIAVTLGIPALVYFLFSLWYAPYSMKRWRSYLYLAFFMVFFLSFFDDDTLETMQGVFFYAFFNSLFLYAMPRESAINTETPIGETKL
jgi:O-antigen ligase